MNKLRNRHYNHAATLDFNSIIPVVGLFSEKKKKNINDKDRLSCVHQEPQKYYSSEALHEQVTDDHSTLRLVTIYRSERSSEYV